MAQTPRHPQPCERGVGADPGAPLARDPRDSARRVGRGSAAPKFAPIRRNRDRRGKARDHEAASAALASRAVRSRQDPARGHGEDPVRRHLPSKRGIALVPPPQPTVIDRIVGIRTAANGRGQAPTGSRWTAWRHRHLSGSLAVARGTAMDPVVCGTEPSSPGGTSGKVEARGDVFARYYVRASTASSKSHRRRHFSLTRSRSSSGSCHRSFRPSRRGSTPTQSCVSAPKRSSGLQTAGTPCFRHLTTASWSGPPTVGADGSRQKTYRAAACPRNGIRRERYAKDQRDPRGAGHKDQK